MPIEFFKKARKKNVEALNDISGLVSNMLREIELGGERHCLLYTSPSPRDATLSRMPSSA